MRVLPEILLMQVEVIVVIPPEWRVKTEIVAFYACEILISTTVKHERLQ